MTNYILEEKVINKKLRRMAFEIMENNPDAGELILVGIRENGSTIARNVQRLLAENSTIKTKLINLSLDKRHPTTILLDDPIDFNSKNIILIDDVSNSGKTMMYALKPFLESFPAKIETLVLVERTHKLFPVKSDYVGISLATTFQDHIYVEVDGERITGAYIE